MAVANGMPELLTVPEAARILGIGRSLAYQLIREDGWPTPVIRTGRLIKIPATPLLRLLATGSAA
jgi:excisionase family DNA binding protein